MPLSLRTVSLNEARCAVENIIAAAMDDRGDPIAIAVVGISGRLVTFSAMDNVRLVSTELATNKALTALVMGRDTVEYHQRPVPPDPANFGSGFCFLGGGVLIRDEQGLTIGAIGVSGRHAYQDLVKYGEILSDDELARVGLAK